MKCKGCKKEKKVNRDGFCVDCLADKEILGSTRYSSFALIGWDTLEYQNRPVYYDRNEGEVLAFPTKKEAERVISEWTGRLIRLQAVKIDPAWEWKTRMIK